MMQVEKATKGKINAIGGFVVGKVDGKVLRDFIQGHGIELDDEGSDELLAVALTQHFREETHADDMCKCEVCQGESPDIYAVCPYCGLEGELEEKAAANGVSSPELEEGDEAEPEESSSSVAAEVKKTDKAKKTAKVVAAHANGKMNEKSNGKSKALTKVPTKEIAKALTTRDLDKAVAEVIKLKTDTATSYWELGRKILDINEKQLWKMRLGDDGRARYAGFDAFCHHELHMSSTHAFTMMGWAREYTAADIAQIGRSKAVLIMKAPPEDRKALAEAAKAGASKRVIASKVKAAKKARGYEGATPAAKRGAKGAKVRAEKIEKRKDVAQDKITVAKIEGLRTIKLYAKPATLKNLDLDECKRAKTIEHQPFGRLELANGVVMYVSILKSKDGFLIAKVDTRRESPV